MLTSTFSFLPGVANERRIWRQDILTWDAFLAVSAVHGIGAGKKLFSDKLVRRAQHARRNDDHAFFTERIPASHHWRIVPETEKIAYLDIETDGNYGTITLVGIYDGTTTHQFVRHHNLDKRAVHQCLNGADIIVTFNGSSFDLPVIQRYFNDVVPDVVHVDVRHLAASVGLTGGLKTIERELGITRTKRHADAIRLWEQYQLSHNDNYLEQLLQYNEADVVNLEPLLAHCINEKRSEYDDVLPFDEL
jgi:uncharacterized protein YprB with RNaseH-like and TPR domain